MPISEQDLEHLDAYLDDALNVADVDALRARLTADAEFAAALSQLRAERSMRHAFFAALEPDTGAADAFTARVRRATEELNRPARRFQPLRYAVAAAALLAIGFFSRGVLDNVKPTNLATDPKAGVDVQQVTGYQVTLRDDAGRVVAVQKFESLEKAQEFAADLSRWQSRTDRVAAGRFVLTADRF